MTNEPTPQKVTLDTRSSSLDWQHYMCTVWPKVMSYVPGGLNYDRSIPMEGRAAEFAHQVLSAVAWAERMGITLNGGLPMPNDPAPYAGLSHEQRWEVVKHLSISANLRKIRQKWKKSMNRLGLNCSDELWRCPHGRDNVLWRDDWMEFQKVIANPDLEDTNER